MKTRKLFAILTLVAFMMTLLPMAAFAADSPNYASKSASKISVGDKSKSAGSDVKVTVALRGTDNRAATALKAGEKLYIWAERAKDSVSDVDEVKEIKNVVSYEVYDKTVLAISKIKTGNVEVKFESDISGDVTFKAAIASDFDVSDMDQYLIGSQSFEWKQLGADKIILLDVNRGATEDEDSKEGNYKWSNFQADGKEYELKFVVTDKKDAPLAGEKVSFTLNKSGAHLNKTEATTDVLGEVKVKVYAYEADVYKLTVKKGSKISVVTMDFGGSDEAFEINDPDPINDKVALESAPTIEFKLFDVFGNRILKGTDGDNKENSTGLYKVMYEINEDDDNVVFSKKPSASKLEDEDIEVEVDGNVLKIKFDQEPDVAGVYEVKVRLPNGKFASCSFQAAEQGDITKMILDIKESYLAYGSRTGSIKVKYYDNNNVFYEDTDLATVELSVSNSALARIDEDNRVVARSASYSDFSSGKVVITAIDTARGLVGTDEITIGSLVAGLEVAVPEESTLLTEAANVTYQLVNQNGDAIAFDAGKKSNIEVDAYVVSKPADANVGIKLPLKSDYQNSLSRTGKIDVKVDSDVAGTVVLAFVVKGEIDQIAAIEKDEDNNDVYISEKITLSSTVDVKFVAERVSIGAENVTLFINSTGYVVDGVAKQSDLAPFIQDNRTFVPVRVVGEALGAEVEWDQATQTVTMAREDKTVTMTVGSNVLTISDGTTVVSDAAPFVAEGNRTVLPFRAIGEAFGAEVEAIFAADGTVSAVQFQQ